MHNFFLYEKNIIRQIKRRNRKTRAQNIQRNYREKKDITNRKELQQNYTSAVLPSEFIFENIEKVLKFINDTYNKCKPSYIRHIFFQLDSVKNIDIYSICLLVSLINKLSHKTRCFGNYPNNKSNKKFLMDSGFLDIVRGGAKHNISHKYTNQLYMIGKNSVESRIIGESIKSSIEFLTGKKNHYPPVYDNMIEICANSVEHSNQNEIDKNWLVSITYEEDNVHFLLTDTGEGILGTLAKKKKEMFRDKMVFKSDATVLEAVFKNGYQSRTGEINRHKGLPYVLETYKNSYISDLLVLTNCVLYNFENGQSKILKNEFKGTMFSWKIYKKNIQTWKKKNCEL